LEEEIQGFIDAGRQGVVVIVGPPGSGKTTALSHLAAVLPSNAGCRLLDNVASAELAEALKDGLCVTTSVYSTSLKSLIASYRLALWTRDDVIEYLLAVHREQCASVLRRFRPNDLALVSGLPELCRVICDELARDDSIVDATAALRRFLGLRMDVEQLADRVRAACLASAALGHRLVHGYWSTELLSILRHRPVQLILAAEELAGLLTGKRKPKFLPGRFPRDLVVRVAENIKGDQRAVEALQRILNSSRGYEPMATSILHFAGAPPSSLGRKPMLRGAYLDGIVWPEANLARANLREVDLRDADLRRADLSGAVLDDALLARAQLSGAILARMSACRADLSNADLSAVRAERALFDSAELMGVAMRDAALNSASFSGTNLEEANLSNSDLSGATLTSAKIAGANLSKSRLDGANLVGLRLRDAELSGASFTSADLSECDLEDVELSGADLSRAKLNGAWLSGSVMREANFTCADLRGTGLAEIDWEGATLCKADLRGATFHMGGSRSGLVGSPIASEGTRTGFYTDEFEEQHFKSPEEIRKANLCGVDLRGALIDGVDFYLVDLRGAKVDAKQEAHLRRSGAILKTSV
jgi:uncharacterized protein YjbI with pentapeptide repeats